jgi:DNA repair protein REV1
MGSRLEKGSQAVRKRIESHSFENEEGDEYEGSKFGGFSLASLPYSVVLWHT